MSRVGTIILCADGDSLGVEFIPHRRPGDGRRFNTASPGIWRWLAVLFRHRLQLADSIALVPGLAAREVAARRLHRIRAVRPETT